MIGGVSLLCFLYNLPDPPLTHWQNMSFQLWNVNRRLCPKFDPYRDTIFHLYTNANKDTSKIIIPHDDESVQQSGIDFFYKTIIFFHGWTESHLSDDAQSIKNENDLTTMKLKLKVLCPKTLSATTNKQPKFLNRVLVENKLFCAAYLQTGTYNVILAQNERLISAPDYLTAANNCKPIGRYAADFIDYLVKKGLRLQDLHVIGLSLGGQIAGMTGQYVRSGKLPRITALDPAGPLFNGNNIDERIDPTDAEFVDVINTNSGTFGMKYSTGHANFWPNGGSKQPGCSIPEIIQRYGFSVPWLTFCHHFRSYQLYVESILFPKSYPAKKCDSYNDYKQGSCRNGDVAYLGTLAEPRNQGDFYLDTGYSGIYNG